MSKSNDKDARIAELEALRREVAMLRGYAEHKTNCEVMESTNMLSGASCTCGLGDAINDTQATALAYEQEVKKVGAIEALEDAAQICIKFMDDRFAEHGSTETDTGAGYYPGKHADVLEARDEEDQFCAMAIRDLARLRATTKKEG